ncbi:hypothetical protein HMPREF9466_01010 [Fusobacterium necrophorum subsp. funduliforme 1_1_36S]|nr:hypothetical protein HMPREF9466_01010 [Fusobacterium necrophorum subsp. funduliforme 1_1_36S]
MYDKSIWQLDMKKLKKELSKDVRLESVEISHEKVGEVDIKVEEKNYFIMHKLESVFI